MTPAFRVTMLWSVAAAAGAAAILTVAWPVDRPPAPIPPALGQSAPPALALDQPADGSTLVVEHNLFDRTRRPPAERELVAAADTFPEPMAIGEGDSVPSSPDASFSVEPVPALFGIVDSPSGRRALLRLDPASPRAALFATGDGTAGWRVVQIGPDVVTLDGPTGRQVVSLSPRPRTP
jgi:hypothetical protein